MRIQGISPSLMTTYGICPMQAFLGRIIQSPPLNLPVWVGTLFGDAMHYFIAHYIYKKSNYPLGFQNKESMLRYWHAFWEDVICQREKLFRNPRPFWHFDKETPETFHAKGHEILSLYWDRNFDKERPSYVELKLGPLYLPPTQIEIVGVIDLITREGLILDFKTGAGYGESEREQFSLIHNPQLIFYSLLYRLAFHQQEAGVGIYHLPTGEIYSTQVEEKEISRIIAAIKQLYDDIANDRFPRYIGHHCRFCDYQEPCYRPGEFFTDERSITDERTQNIVFAEFEQPPLQLIRDKSHIIPKPNAKPYPIPPKPKQLRLF